MSAFSNAQGTILPSLEAGLRPGQGYDVAALMAPPPLPPPQLPLNLNTSSTKRGRAPKAPTKSKVEWEAYRDNIHRLYVDENLSLDGVMKTMGHTYNFHASRIQYGSKIKEWGFQKNIRESHMRAIARKKLSRQSGAVSKASTFRLRSRPVPEQKIDRYMRANSLDEHTVFSDAPTPSDISCETPGSLAIQSPGAVSTLPLDTGAETTSDDGSPAGFEDIHHREVHGISTRKEPWPLSEGTWSIDLRRTLKPDIPSHCSTRARIMDLLKSTLSQIAEDNPGVRLPSSDATIFDRISIEFASDFCSPFQSSYRVHPLLPMPHPTRITVRCIFGTTLINKSSLLSCSCVDYSEVLLAGLSRMRQYFRPIGTVEVVQWPRTSVFLEFYRDCDSRWFGGGSIFEDMVREMGELTEELILRIPAEMDGDGLTKAVYRVLASMLKW